MEDVKVCRICLVLDVRMYNLNMFPLDTYIELVVGINPLNTMDLPPYVCFECAALLRKYFKFHEKCLLGQSVLYGIIQSNGKITSQQIKELNRKELNLNSPLAKNNSLEESTLNILHEETLHHDVTYREELNKIKREPNDNIDFLNESTDSIKLEDLNDDFHIDGLSSDDEKPLALHKEKKNKGRKKVKKKKKQKEEEDDLQESKNYKSELEQPYLEIEVKVGETETEGADIPLPVKRKRGRPRKDETTNVKVKKPRSRRTINTGGVLDDDVDDDIEQYATVVKLSVEEQIQEVTKRQLSSNYLNASFQCNLCFKGFVDTDAWRHHVGKHDPSSGDVECPICKFRFKTKRALQKHAAHHEKKYACKSCSYVSKTSTQAKLHHKWHKGVTYQCQHCEDCFDKWTSYLSHVRMKHPSEHVCGACGYCYVSELGLAMHRSMMHKDILDNPEGGSGPYCAACDVHFVGEEAYKRHMVTSIKHTHSTDVTTGCRVCGETFNSKEEYRLHHRKEHARKRPKNYGKKPSNITFPANCVHCSVEVRNAREYWAHFRRAHPDLSYPVQRNHVCDICGKSFRGNAFLVYHKRTHFEERAYKCAKCPKAFFNRTNLQMHEKIHSDVRPYPCNVCFKAFKGKGSLDRHYRSHTGVKPYECELCGKAFGQSNSRKLHVRTVHLKQPAPYVSRARLERRRQQTETVPVTVPVLYQ